MEKTKLPPPTMTRTEYVISNLIGVRNPMEFSVAEKMALRRLSEPVSYTHLTLPTKA